jgi:hypothetical protein
VAYQVQAAAGKPEKIGVDLAPAGVVARSGVVAHLRRAPFVDRLGDEIDRLAVFAITLVRAEPDGKYLLHGPHIIMSLGRQRRRRFAERGLERLGDRCAVEGFQKIAAKEQRHQLGSREAERGDIAEAFHQPPARLAIVLFGYERKADGFERFEIAPHGAGVFRVVVGNVVDKLLKAPSWRALKLPQQMPLAGNLIVSRHVRDARVPYENLPHGVKSRASSQITRWFLCKLR